MTDSPQQLAVRLAGRDFALEADRDYVLGSGDDCDLRVAGAGPRHLRLRVTADGVAFEDLGSGHGTWFERQQVAHGVAPLGARLHVGRSELVIVVDAGQATLVPLPELRRAARSRKIAAAQKAAALDRPREQGFADLMADELAHAPWLAWSLAAHLLVLLALWLLLPVPDDGGKRPAVVAIDLDLAGSPSEAPPEPPAVEPEPVSSPELPDEPMQLPVQDPPEAAPEPNLSSTLSTLGSNPHLALRRTRGGDLGSAGSAEFRRAVGELRHTGLEIVFVIDSTGSMTRAIADTKATIHEMLLVLRALVPDARIGLVTYRDRGRREDYLTREVPLGIDYWQAVNFVQDVLAEGGGDRPEAVREGLERALDQPWQPRARRVVVLAGDAPPHDDTFEGLLHRLRAFSKDGRSFVHTLLTSPDHAGEDTRTSFQTIATAGRGQAVELAARDRILLEVLALAFGREFHGDLQEVTATVLAARDFVDARSLDLARRGGDDLRAALFVVPVDATLVNALIRRPRRAVYRELHVWLQDPATPNPTRQAIAWVLQRALELPMSPVDAVDPRMVNQRVHDRTVRAIERLPE